MAAHMGFGIGCLSLGREGEREVKGWKMGAVHVPMFVCLFGAKTLAYIYIFFDKTLAYIFVYSGI